MLANGKCKQWQVGVYAGVRTSEPKWRRRPSTAAGNVRRQFVWTWHGKCLRLCQCLSHSLTPLTLLSH